MRKVINFALTAAILSAPIAALASDGKLLATAGLTQIEGSGGGGLVPWATLTGYDTREQISASIFSTRVDLDDYQLDAIGVGASFYDRVELSVAQQQFRVDSLNTEIEQSIAGAKVRLYGDVLYSKWPQVSIGVQHKRLKDPAIASLLGADETGSGTDIYLSATKVHLAGAYGFNVVWNLTGRMTKANQLGLLGYGGVNNSSYELMLEASAGVLLSRNVVVGMEYRQKPDNLSIREDDWKDVFVSYIPNKHFNATLAWAELGSIAGAKKQNGLYLSLTGYF